MTTETSGGKVEPGGNVEALKAAGMIQKGLHEAYHSVFENLSNPELGAFMLLKARLDAVKRQVGEGYEEFLPL